MLQRSARYGRNLYEIRVKHPDHLDGKALYLCADSITVREGTLMLAAEVEEEDEGTEQKSIEMPPVAIFPTGQWLSVLLVTWDDHEVLFSEDFVNHLQEDD